MKPTLDSSAISSLISTTTNEIITSLETYVSNLEPIPDTTPEIKDGTVVYIWVNGLKYQIPIGDYNNLKQQQAQLKSTMKAQIKQMVDQFKADLKAYITPTTISADEITTQDTIADSEI